jgi:hypothetical protein
MRDMVVKEQYGMCAKCGQSKRLEVHHKTMLTHDNIHNAEITLNRVLLEGLCYDCHMRADEHDYNKNKSTSEGIMFNEDGEPIER